jgi:hypothetical protein
MQRVSQQNGELALTGVWSFTQAEVVLTNHKIWVYAPHLNTMLKQNENIYNKWYKYYGSRICSNSFLNFVIILPTTVLRVWIKTARNASQIRRSEFLDLKLRIYIFELYEMYT